MLDCCCSAIKDALKGVSLLTALGGLAALLAGAKALLPLGAAASNPSVAWFGWVLCVAGALLLALGAAAATGSWCGLTAPLHCFTGAALALLPLQVLLVWAADTHPSELRRLADRDQTYTLSRILDWVDAHHAAAAGLAGMWLLLQAAAVLLGCAYTCCLPRPRSKHPWDRFWRGDEESREALLPQGGSPRREGYHTPPSRFHSPYASPGRLPVPGRVATGATQDAP